MTAIEALCAPLPSCGRLDPAKYREAAASHARTIQWLLAGIDDPVAPPLPTDVGMVAALFAQTICDYRADLVGQLAGMVRDTAGHDPVDLAEAILRHIDIPEDSPGGFTLTDAFTRYLTMASACTAPAARRWNAETAVTLAAEAVCVWARERPEPTLRHPACPNNPATLLAAAKAYLTEKGES